MPSDSNSTSFERRSLTRRTLLAAAGSSGVAALLAACASPTPTQAPAAPAAPAATQAPAKTAATPAPATAASPAPAKPAAAAPAVAAKPATGRIVFGTPAASSKSNDPAVVGSGQAGEYFWPSFTGLTWFDSEAAVRPGVAQSWQSVDPKTWVFMLQDNIKFHDGTPVEAADVAGSFTYYLKPETKAQVAINFPSIDKVEAVDPKTVRISLKNPDPTLLKRVALAMIMPWQQIEKSGMDAYLKQPIGTGPYRWVSSDWNNGHKWEAMPPDFFSPAGQAAVAQFEMRFIPEPATMAAALRSGDLDVAERLSPDLTLGLIKDGYPPDDDRGAATTSFSLYPFDGPTQDVRVRQAINYAVDKAAILKTVMGGLGELDGQMIGKEVLGYNPSVNPYPYDVAKAKQLLADAGYANGFRLPMWVNQTVFGGKDVGEAVAAYLQAVGIGVDINVLETAVWVQRSFADQSQRRGIFVGLLPWDPTYEADAVWKYFTPLVIPPDRGGRWSDPKFDEMLKPALAELDDKKRSTLFQTAGQYFHDQAPVLFMFRFYRPGNTAKNVKWQGGFFADMFTSRRLSKSG